MMLARARVVNERMMMMRKQKKAGPKRARLKVLAT
jgi:hypothetical protein